MTIWWEYSTVGAIFLTLCRPINKLAFSIFIRSRMEIVCKYTAWVCKYWCVCGEHTEWFIRMQLNFLTMKKKLVRSENSIFTIIWGHIWSIGSIKCVHFYSHEHEHELRVVNDSKQLHGFRACRSYTKCAHVQNGQVQWDFLICSKVTSAVAFCPHMRCILFFFFVVSHRINRNRSILIEARGLIIITLNCVNWIRFDRVIRKPQFKGKKCWCFNLLAYRHIYKLYGKW